MSNKFKRSDQQPIPPDKLVGGQGSSNKFDKVRPLPMPPAKVVLPISSDKLKKLPVPNAPQKASLPADKIKVIRQIPVPPDNNQRGGINDLTLGAWLDRSPRLLPAGATPNIDHIRFEEGALRKDFGSTIVGTARGTRILGVGEHKYLLNGEFFHRLIALYLEGGLLALDIWDGASWVRTDISTDVAADVYLSLASTQDRFLIADGIRILTWYESATTQDEFDEFPTGNSLDSPGDTADAVITPAGAIDDEYSIYFSVDLTITNGADYDVVVALEHEGVEVATRLFELAAGTQAWVDEVFNLVRAIADLETLTLKVKSVLAGTYPTQSVNWGAAAPQAYEATKNTAEEAHDDNYTYRLTIGVMTIDTQINFLYDTGSGQTIIGSRTYVAGVDEGDHEEVFQIPGMGLNSVFAMERVSGDGNLSPQTPGVEWEALIPGTDYTLAVHGYNQTDDVDAFHGVEYAITVPPVSVLEELSANAPGARFILPFGDRLLAYRDGSDHQVAAWSADGDIADWVGGDSGSVVLIDTRSDGIDDIMGAAVLSSAVVAVFRKRSIMRAQETGNVALAMAHFHWIENLGTESTFSIRSTPAGIIFLGHDLQVYLLTETGPRPIGMPIHDELVRRLTSNLDLVDSIYDQVFGEYWLGIPEDNASAITGVWIFDLNKYLQEQKIVWRYRSMAVERFAIASVIE